jgi:hypothetical protein
MNRREQIMADALLRIAVIENHERELQKIDAAGKNARFSPNHEKRMKRMFKREHLHAGVIGFGKIAGRATLVLSVTVMLASFALFANAGVRAAVNDVIITWFGDHASFRYSDGNIETVSREWMPGYLPEGFTATRANYENGDTERWYSDSNGRTVFFGAYTVGSSISGIDNGHADYTAIKRDGVDYRIFASNEMGYPSGILWELDSHSFILNAELDKETLLEIAQSCKTTP